MANKDLTSLTSGQFVVFGDPLVGGVTNGTIIDTSMFYSLTFFQITGSLGPAMELFASMVHGDEANLSDGTPVTESDIIGSTLLQPGNSLVALNLDTIVNPNPAQEDRVWQVGYIGKKRYVRWDINVLNPTLTSFYAVVAVRGDAADGATIVNT